MVSFEDKGLGPPGSVEGPVGRRSSGAAPDVLTNGNLISGTRDVFRFQKVAEHEGSLWVKAVNGPFRGELLTFSADALTSVNAERAS